MKPTGGENHWPLNGWLLDLDVRIFCKFTKESLASGFRWHLENASHFYRKYMPLYFQKLEALISVNMRQNHIENLES